MKIHHASITHTKPIATSLHGKTETPQNMDSVGINTRDDFRSVQRKPEDREAGKHITEKENKMLKDIKRATRKELLGHGILSRGHSPILWMAGSALLMTAGAVGACAVTAAIGIVFGAVGVVSALSHLKINVDLKNEIDKSWKNTFMQLPENKSSKLYEEELLRHAGARSILSYWPVFEYNMQKKKP